MNHWCSNWWTRVHHSSMWFQGRLAWLQLGEIGLLLRLHLGGTKADPPSPPRTPTWWIRLSSTQVESTADSNLVQLEPLESVSHPCGAAADLSPPVRVPLSISNLSGNLQLCKLSFFPGFILHHFLSASYILKLF